MCARKISTDMDEIKYIEPQQENRLFSDVCQIIDGARSRIATYVNTEACLTNWYVGKRIKEDVLYNKRAEYGKQVILNLSAKLTARYGSGWSEKTLRHCLRSAETFSEDDIVSAKPLLSPESTITNSPKEPRSTKRAPLLPPRRNNPFCT